MRAIVSGDSGPPPLCDEHERRRAVSPQPPITTEPEEQHTILLDASVFGTWRRGSKVRYWPTQRWR